MQKIGENRPNGVANLRSQVLRRGPHVEEVTLVERGKKLARLAPKVKYLRKMLGDFRPTIC